MLTNLQTAAIMIVFAGGPHTPERTDLACELLVSRPPPAVIYLTGTEYSGEYSNLTAHVRAIAAELPGAPVVITDTCSTTWASCRRLARELHSRYPKGAKLTVVTSNYHAPRAHWLLKAAIVKLLGCRVVVDKETSGFSLNNLSTQQPNNYLLTFVTSPDIPWRDSFSSSRNRQLLWGEFLSWLYSFPLGLFSAISHRHQDDGG